MLTILDFSIRIVCAVLFGFAIGLERQFTGHNTGIRINVLISMGACLFTLFSQLMGVYDTTRIAAQVVTGIGFLCSGIMFKEGANVRGLNTAATMWCTAAIGVLTSSGQLHFATIAVAILIGSNLIFRLVADKIPVLSLPIFSQEESTYVLSVTCTEADEFHIRSAIIKRLRQSQMRLTNLESADDIGNKVEIEATIQNHGRQRDEYIETLTSQVALEKGVTKAGWEMLA